MNFYKFFNILKEQDEITFKNNLTDAYSGQTNFTLSMMVNKENVGYLDYVEYLGKPYINFIKIHPKYQRKSYGTKLLQHLQSLYPNHEIEWGSTTPQGEALRNSLKYKLIEKPEVIEKLNKLNWAKKQLKILELKGQEYEKGDIELYRKWIRTVSDKWHKLHDLIYKLENDKDLQQSPIKKLIEH